MEDGGWKETRAAHEGACHVAMCARRHWRLPRAFPPSHIAAIVRTHFRLPANHTGFLQCEIGDLSVGNAGKERENERAKREREGEREEREQDGEVAHSLLRSHVHIIAVPSSFLLYFPCVALPCVGSHMILLREGAVLLNETGLAVASLMSCTHTHTHTTTQTQP